MRQLSVLSVLILVVFFALVFTLFARFHAEAFAYVTGPILGATLAALAYRRDKLALIIGGIVGGLCQGIFAVMVLKKGYIFPDIGMMTGALFLENLAAHLMIGLIFGTLFHLAFRRARPRGQTTDS